MPNDMKRNLTMLTDFYEITMSNGYFQYELEDRIAVFDMFFRKIPDGGGFALFAGLEQLVEYLKNLEFTQEDIEYLRSRIFSASRFWSICAVSAFHAMFGRCGREPRSFLMSRSSLYAAQLFRRN